MQQQLFVLKIKLNTLKENQEKNATTTTTNENPILIFAVID